MGLCLCFYACVFVFICHFAFFTLGEKTPHNKRKALHTTALSPGKPGSWQPCSHAGPKLHWTLCPLHADRQCAGHPRGHAAEEG